MTSVSVLLLSYLFVKFVIGHIRAERVPDELRLRVMLTLFAEIIVLILCYLAGAAMVEAAFFISFNLTGLFFATLSFVPKNFAVRVFNILLSVEALYIFYRILSLFADVPVPSAKTFLYGIMAVPVVVLVGYAFFLSLRVADLKHVLRCGSVWNSVCIIVDIIYMTALITYTCLFVMSVIHYTTPPVLIVIVFSVMMISIMIIVSESKNRKWCYHILHYC